MAGSFKQVEIAEESGSRRDGVSTVLVIFQFALSAIIIAITATANWTVPTWLSVTGTCLLALGVAVAVWAWLAMGLTRLRIFPEPAKGSQLITRGPYRWIRHPMYSGLMVALGGIALFSPTWLNALCWSLLVVVLWMKAGREERLLAECFNDYRGYAQSTGRFLPRWQQPPDE